MKVQKTELDKEIETVAQMYRCLAGQALDNNISPVVIAAAMANDRETSAFPNSGHSFRPNQAEIEVRFRPEALVIGRVFRDLVPSTMAVHIVNGECHDLLCRTRRFTAYGSPMCHR